MDAQTLLQSDAATAVADSARAASAAIQIAKGPQPLTTELQRALADQLDIHQPGRLFKSMTSNGWTEEAALAALLKAAAISQPVTPDLRKWVAEQADAGYEPVKILASMTSQGWTERTALAALLESAAVIANRPAPVQPRTVPEPSLEESPSTIVAADRTVKVLMHMRNPRLVVFGDFLSDVECDELIELARPSMERSTTVDRETGEGLVTDIRTSRGMFFNRTGEAGQPELVRRIDARAAALLNWPVDRAEALQVLHYGPGDQYRPHYDYFYTDSAASQARLKRGGQRVGTLLIYLNTPGAGGGTIFPDVEFEVRAVRGQAVFFSYERPDPDSRSLHGGMPVIQGEKWVATRWLRQYAF
jgi:prolyl 4-hydroxylase